MTEHDAYVVIETLQTPDLIAVINVYGPGPEAWAERKTAELGMEELPDGATERSTSVEWLCEPGRSSHLGEKALVQ